MSEIIFYPPKNKFYEKPLNNNNLNLPLISTVISIIPNPKPILESEKTITILKSIEEKKLSIFNNIDIEKVSEKRTSTKKNIIYSVSELRKIAKLIGVNSVTTLNKKELANIILDYYNLNKK